MARRDSVDKIIQSYVAAVCAAPFEYKGHVYEVPSLHVSPLMLRGFTCPEGCGGCCPVFSLDYLPSEKHPYELHYREVLVNGVACAIYSDLQAGVEGPHCANLRKHDGRCGIHGAHPFSCDFELIRFLEYSGEFRAVTRLYGRGWNMLRVDGQRGALCTITPCSQDAVDEVVRKLQRLAQWCEHFGVPHRINLIVQWAQSHPQDPLILPALSTRKGLLE